MPHYFAKQTFSMRAFNSRRLLKRSNRLKLALARLTCKWDDRHSAQPLAQRIAKEMTSSPLSPQVFGPRDKDPGVIYDVGANNGDDIPYYLSKTDLVVAIEADPDLAAQIERRFASEISKGQLIVESCVVTADEGGGNVPFYLHQGHHVLNQFIRPNDADMHNFREVSLPSKRLVDVIQAHGAPHYVKIDVEGYDQSLLAALFTEGIRPPYVSAESHSVEVFAVLIALGHYNAFKWVNGHTVHEVYRDFPIRTAQKETVFSFPYHSAGPFGNDVLGRWETANTFLRTLADAGFGWSDIHASAVDLPEA